MRRIIHAAIIERKEPHKVFTGKHHAECFAKYKTINPQVIQGFVVDDGCFVTRKEAAAIAFKAGQIDKELKVGEEIFSEDFWSDIYRGKHNYNPEKGYVLKK